MVELRLVGEHFAEAMDMICKGRVRRVAKGDAVAQVKFIGKRFGITA